MFYNNRNNKREQNREILRLYRELQRMWRDRREGNNGSLVELETPYQLGWDRYFVLRDDIKTRKDVHVISKILTLINNTIYSRKGDFKLYNYKIKKWEPISQTIESIDLSTFEMLSEKEKSFFHKRYELRYSSAVREKVWQTRYVFRFPEFFVFKIVPHMITHQWIPDSEWERRYTEINNKIRRNNLWPKIVKLLGGSFRMDKNYGQGIIKYKYPDANWDLEEELDLID